MATLRIHPVRRWGSERSTLLMSSPSRLLGREGLRNESRPPPASYFTNPGEASLMQTMVPSLPRAYATLWASELRPY